MSTPTSTDTGAQTDDQIVARRTVDASAPAIFALLTDPARHSETEPGDWVREAIEPTPITTVGDVFAMAMFHEGRGGEYVMHNRVSDLVPDRTVAWHPGWIDDDGEHQAAGWLWRYDLAALDDDRTLVTLTYNWGAASADTVAEVGGFPPFPPAFLDESLAALDRAVTGT